ncbi:MAG: esterase/lipase family protein [Kofleriaceae bacterium]
MLVHGQGGHYTDLRAITIALEAAGYCVWGADYGIVNGRTGLDHLDVSGAQLAAFIDHVLAKTGAQQVDAIGYSEGTGVIANYVLARGGASRVHRAISYGGLHHPYAHASAAGFADSDVFLPNVFVEARKVVPGITAQQVVISALDLYAAAGGQLAGIDRQLATSAFAADLFEPNYWRALHGSLSEPEGTILRLLSDGHGLPTRDAAPTICYTNFVSNGDLITGPSAGFQDPAPNVENIFLVGGADHGGIISDPVAIAKTLAALGAPCAPAQGGDPSDPSDPNDPGSGGPGDPGGSNDPGAGDGGDVSVGCAATSSSAAGGAWLAALALILLRRRRATPAATTARA